ncbi:hypothetical protein HDU96_010387 [Phlyctochytrium bullatum]|nr:hypothetical protein HDU96_010387 [Phlyctochytrium bullatum]
MHSPLRLVHLLLMLLAIGGGIRADVSLSPGVAIPGSLISASLRRLRDGYKGCIGTSPTTQITIGIPDDVLFANAHRAAGWSLSLKYRNGAPSTTSTTTTTTTIANLAAAVTAPQPSPSGPSLTAAPESTVTTAPAAVVRRQLQPAVNVTADTPTLSSITWSNGNLAPGEYEDFEILILVPNGPDGKRIYFPVFQYCGAPSSSVLAYNARTEGPGQPGGPPLLPIPPVTAPAPAATTTGTITAETTLASAPASLPAPYITLGANGTALRLEALLAGSGVDAQKLRAVAGASATSATFSNGIPVPAAATTSARAAAGRGVAGAVGAAVVAVVGWGLVWACGGLAL